MNGKRLSPYAVVFVVVLLGFGFLNVGRFFQWVGENRAANRPRSETAPVVAPEAERESPPNNDGIQSSPNTSDDRKGLENQNRIDANTNGNDRSEASIAPLSNVNRLSADDTNDERALDLLTKGIDGALRDALGNYGLWCNGDRDHLYFLLLSPDGSNPVYADLYPVRFPNPDVSLPSAGDRAQGIEGTVTCKLYCRGVRYGQPGGLWMDFKSPGGISVNIAATKINGRWIIDESSLDDFRLTLTLYLVKDYKVPFKLGKPDCSTLPVS